MLVNATTDVASLPLPIGSRSVRVAERLALPTSDHGVAGSNPAGGEILPEPKRRFIAQSLSCSSSHRLEMTEILLKGRKTLTHPSIQSAVSTYCIHCTVTKGLTILLKNVCASKNSGFNNCFLYIYN